MITSVDTNVIVALWNTDEALNLTALDALEAAFARGGVVICGAVYSELLAYPRRTEDFIGAFLSDTEIAVDWSTDEAVWRSAGLAFQKYTARRRRQKASEPRRILTDFCIGAHAQCNGYSLLTLDDRIYRAGFPALHIYKCQEES